MDHQPFEDWLLNDSRLTPAERRELDLHLRTCVHCTALSATGLALRSANAAAPAPGFSLRFQQRLAAQKIVERRRRVWGMLVLGLGGAGLLTWVAVPLVLGFLASPAGWLTTVISYFLFLSNAVRAMTGVASVLLRVAPAIVPPYLWMVIFSAAAGFGLLWTVSIWRFSRRAAQGVTA